MPLVSSETFTSKEHAECGQQQTVIYKRTGTCTKLNSWFFSSNLFLSSSSVNGSSSFPVGCILTVLFCSHPIFNPAGSSAPLRTWSPLSIYHVIRPSHHHHLSPRGLQGPPDWSSDFQPILLRVPPPYLRHNTPKIKADFTNTLKTSKCRQEPSKDGRVIGNSLLGTWMFTIYIDARLFPPKEKGHLQVKYLILSQERKVNITNNRTGDITCLHYGALRRTHRRSVFLKKCIPSFHSRG